MNKVIYQALIEFYGNPFKMEFDAFSCQHTGLDGEKEGEGERESESVKNGIKPNKINRFATQFSCTQWKNELRVEYKWLTLG